MKGPIRREIAFAGPLRVREAEDGQKSRTIEGYALLFGVRSRMLCDWYDAYYEQLEPGCVTREILDACDIKMTMFHNREKILARSKMGVGTLAYEVESTSLVYRLLEQQAGAALMPVSQLLRLRALFPDSPILVIPLEEGVPPASLGVSYHKGYPLTDAANAFIQFAIDLLVQEKVRMTAAGITSRA